MKEFELAGKEEIKRDQWAVQEIDFSILLAHVFGKPIRAEQAFMYFFRRYGLPNARHDDYKDLCRYLFNTNDEGVLIQWRLATGDYHCHLCAFADKADYVNFRFKPINDYHKKIQELAENDGLVYFGVYPPFRLWEKVGEETKFMGNDRQCEAIDKMCGEYSDDCDHDKAWTEIFDRMIKNDKEIEEKYSNIAYPELEGQYGKTFCSQFNRQVEAGKEQHEYIMSLPEGHFLRRVYFAAMALFEDWKRPTYIRDQSFNMTCDDDVDGFGDDSVGYTDFWEQLGEVKE